MPSAVPRLLTALRISAPAAVHSALSAEWLIGTAGLGYLFGQASTRLAQGTAWSAIVVAMVLAVVAFGIAARIEARGRQSWT
jgi:NitT/TauT family transport system permease protein